MPRRSGSEGLGDGNLGRGLSSEGPSSGGLPFFPPITGTGTPPSASPNRALGGGRNGMGRAATVGGGGPNGGRAGAVSRVPSGENTFMAATSSMTSVMPASRGLAGAGGGEGGAFKRAGGGGGEGGGGRDRGGERGAKAFIGHRGQGGNGALTPPLDGMNEVGRVNLPSGAGGALGLRKKGMGPRSWLRIDQNGETEPLAADKYMIMRRASIPARDLRILDPLLSYPSTVLGRERAIVVNLEHIKCIITADEVLLLNWHTPEVGKLVEDLKHRLPTHFNALGEQVAGDGGGGLTATEMEAAVRRNNTQSSSSTPSSPPASYSPPLPEAGPIGGTSGMPAGGTASRTASAASAAAAVGAASMQRIARAALGLLPPSSPTRQPPPRPSQPQQQQKGREAIVEGEDSRGGQPRRGGPNALPFEFRALEACLEAACGVLDRETMKLEQEAYPALDELTGTISTLNLERVRQIKSRLVTLSGRVQKVRDELEQLLDDDEDMNEMYLTEKAEKRALGELSRGSSRAAAILSNENSTGVPASSAPVAIPTSSSGGEGMEAGPSPYLADGGVRGDSGAGHHGRRFTLPSSILRPSPQPSQEAPHFSSEPTPVLNVSDSPILLPPHGSAPPLRTMAGVPHTPSSGTLYGDSDDSGRGGGEPLSLSRRSSLRGGHPGSTGAMSMLGAAPESMRLSLGGGGSVGSRGGGGGSRGADESSASSVRQSEKSLDVEELEMLLEAYFVQIDGSLNKLSSLREYVDDTEDYINIMLDDKQNSLLQMNVFLTTATLFISMFVVVTGVFGMNVPLRFFNRENPENYIIFYWVVGGCTAGAATLFFAVVYYARRKGLV